MTEVLVINKNEDLRSYLFIYITKRYFDLFYSAEYEVWGNAQFYRNETQRDFVKSTDEGEEETASINDYLEDMFSKFIDFYSLYNDEGVKRLVAKFKPSEIDSDDPKATKYGTFVVLHKIPRTIVIPNSFEETKIIPLTKRNKKRKVMLDSKPVEIKRVDFVLPEYDIVSEIKKSNPSVPSLKSLSLNKLLEDDKIPRKQIPQPLKPYTDKEVEFVRWTPDRDDFYDIREITLPLKPKQVPLQQLDSPLPSPKLVSSRVPSPVFTPVSNPLITLSNSSYRVSDSDSEVSGEDISDSEFDYLVANKEVVVKQRRKYNWVYYLALFLKLVFSVVIIALVVILILYLSSIILSQGLDPVYSYLIISILAIFAVIAVIAFLIIMYFLV